MEKPVGILAFSVRGALCYNQQAMVEEHKSAPGKTLPSKGQQWLSWAMLGVLVLVAVAAGVWVGLGQPHQWQTLRMLPTVTPLVTPFVTSLPTTTPPSTSDAALPSLLPTVTPQTQPVRSNPATFTSREVVTTTLAVPLDAWPHGPAQSVAISADGRWVAFTAARDSGPDDLYLYDREAEQDEDALITVTVGVDGEPSNGWVGAPALVPDGRYVAFYAWASNLVAGDTNAVQDLFFYDREAATISRISVAAGGGQANDRTGDSRGASAPALSADGRYVAFHSLASNLVPGDTNGRADVFLFDRQTQQMTLISQGPGGTAGNGDNTHPALSVDGRYVLFASRATNLDPSVPALAGPGVAQIYLHDRSDGSTTLISRGPDGRPGDGESSTPAISGDGRYLVYASRATNLVAGDTNGAADIFLHDRTTGTTRRVSVSSAGIQGNRDAWLPQISLDGQHILFNAAASNLVSGDGNSGADLFVHDQWARHTSRVSVAVRGTWRGEEANGPTEVRGAIIPGGRLVAFVSSATNLVTADEGVPALFLHERVDTPTFTLAGVVTEHNGLPVAGAVVAAGPHRTTTDENGRYRLPALVGGTYTLAVAKPGYTFSPPRRTVSLLRNLDGQDFLAFAGGDPAAFLDLPLPYDGTAATLLALLRDTDEGGWIDAWFDHDAPDYRQNGTMLLWDGRPRTESPYNETLGCFERRCYEGHDGVDFPYRDPNPATPNIFEPITVRAAAPGEVAAVVDACESGDQWCNRGYGNEVILWHNNGYFTRYSHLAAVAVAPGQGVTPDLALGEMGSTGNSYGTHLHFAVHLDNGNGAWDGDRVDLPVDPFGWAGVEADPWAAQATGPVSRWLWRFNPTTEAILLGSEGATLRDGVGGVTVQIPPGALAGQVRVELVTGAAMAPPATPQRTLGRGFRLQVLDWLQGGNAINATPARPVEISVSYAGATTRHLDLGQLLLYHWRVGAGWMPLPTVVDREAQAVIAASNQLGDFDLHAPLLCPEDALEPDDSFDAASFAPTAGGKWTRLFDVAEDEDWFQVEAAAGTRYVINAVPDAPGVALTVAAYDRDGLTRLAGREDAGALLWTPAEAGSYFVRVAPAATSRIGCDARYTLTIATQE